MAKLMQNDQCYCGSSLLYLDCCGGFINGEQAAQQPEQLMRSRYSAFCIGNVDYLVATLHPEMRQEDDREILKNTIANTHWNRLKVIATRLQSPLKGEVEFVVFYGSTAQEQMHELSRFVKENGRWYYLDGQMLSHYSLGRNELCWCGEDKKLKHCHRIS